MWDIFAYVGIAYTSALCVGIAAYMYARHKRKQEPEPLKGWFALTFGGYAGEPCSHILPLNDTDNHAPSHECKCNPRIEHVEGGYIVKHNSYDGREAVEEAYNILNRNED